MGTNLAKICFWLIENKFSVLIAACDSHIDVVLVDTAGRMQDNEPLMRALAKLIAVNAALADHSANDNPHTIDGIVLTKFDTIDDKVGSGQTYPDLKSLDAKAVVPALMK